MVAEVSANLAHDGRHRERDELRAVIDVVRFTALIEPTRADLDEVLQRLATVPETASDVVGQRRRRAMMASRSQQAIDSSSSISPDNRNMIVTSSYSEFSL